MQIIITGGAGFLGQRLAVALLRSSIDFTELLLVDLVMPPNVGNDPRVRCRQADLSEPAEVRDVMGAKTGILFHLAAVVSSQAEQNFDLGWRVNLDITRLLLEASREANTRIRFIFTSSLAVYGGVLPEIVDDSTAITPRSSYGTQKAMGELLVNDYSRKGYIDGLALRLPTICVRPGKPNMAASSFVSSIIREPINGEPAICPVSVSLPLWLSSPDTVVQNLLHATRCEYPSASDWRSINLPGIHVTVQEMLKSLERMTDKATLARVQFKPDEAISRIVSGWPGRIDNKRAMKMGFRVDDHFDHFITQYIEGQKGAVA